MQESNIKFSYHMMPQVNALFWLWFIRLFFLSCVSYLTLALNNKSQNMQSFDYISPEQFWRKYLCLPQHANSEVLQKTMLNRTGNVTQIPYKIRKFTINNNPIHVILRKWCTYIVCFVWDWTVFHLWGRLEGRLSPEACMQCKHYLSCQQMPQNAFQHATAMDNHMLLIKMIREEFSGRRQQLGQRHQACCFLVYSVLF